jgi:hypothetical protein
MTINLHWTESARAIFAAFRHTLGPKFTLGLENTLTGCATFGFYMTYIV